ncbi:hypothetical protein LDG_7277 [Legionella drancourtii LLAP12]|uniref:Uncharacterized protein n=1 Tax=Legionella drancourtii LLAP12 TaxID=658187 RepID=G9EPT7_9GAMM|nr:hypothetical protein LDG_7277 [Legionella drancourtii LLAP12]
MRRHGAIVGGESLLWAVFKSQLFSMASWVICVRISWLGRCYCLKR